MDSIPVFGEQWADAATYYDYIDERWVDYSPIRRCMEEIGDNDGWWSAMKILPHFEEALIFWVIGARRIGKTDYELRLACEIYRRFGLKTLWCRNKDVELQDKRFSESFLADAKRFGWCPSEWVAKLDGVYTSRDKDKGDKVIDFQAISTFGNRRGGAHPRTILIVLDEFMPEDRRYPPMPAIGLMSLTKTVLAGNRNARVLCTSNFTEGSNPYFVQYQIYPDADKDITLCQGRNLIERARGYRTALQSDNPWAENYRRGGYAEYASEQEDPTVKLIKPIPRGATPGPWILQHNGVRYRYHVKGSMIYWDRMMGAEKGTVIYTDSLKETDDKVTLIPSWLVKQLRGQYEYGAMRFKTPNVLFGVMSVLYETI